ncbi:MAG TPA: DsrE family protein [Candidatus Avalokitesvara rifleensis]|uniref:DsrE family protein n=1 Tax=Candidatus Avalokitesvara rifleensis TaxID=3367620 RepID=UPI002713D2D2|nr:DsrE family protein [Candidatus Brocadiales bacterium]
MAQKTALIIMNQAPFGNIYYTEGLRAAVGITSGVDENIVTVAYVGDGIYFTLHGVDRKDTERYIATLQKQKARMLVERESLKERGIKERDVATEFEIIPRKELLTFVQKADFVLDF